MFTKKTIIKYIFFLIISLAAGLIVMDFALSQTCPQNSQAGETQAILVGEITDDGGDPNLEVWFQYGMATSYGYESSHSSKSGVGIFCADVYNLHPCTLYHYRAVARNSADTSYGNDQSFTTKCLPVSVDIKANNSDGPVTLYYKDYVTLSWTSQNAASCLASGDWSGSKSTSGSQTIQLNSVKTYTFTLTCTDTNGGQSSDDSVQVIVKPKPPTVITKPAVVTL